jgi:hypothetical protein
MRFIKVKLSSNRMNVLIKTRALPLSAYAKRKDHMRSQQEGNHL